MAATQEQLLKYAEYNRNNPTKSEKMFINKLKSNGIGFEFQKIIKYYIVDFYVPIINWVIELDGDSHNGREDYDNKRDAIIRNEGYKITRINNCDVKHFNVKKFVLSKQDFLNNKSLRRKEKKRKQKIKKLNSFATPKQRHFMRQKGLTFVSDLPYELRSLTYKDELNIIKKYYKKHKHRSDELNSAIMSLKKLHDKTSVYEK